MAIWWERAAPCCFYFSAVLIVCVPFPFVSVPGHCLFICFPYLGLLVKAVFSRFIKYRKFPKYSDTQKIVVITLKFELCGSTIE